MKTMSFLIFLFFFLLLSVVVGATVQYVENGWVLEEVSPGPFSNATKLSYNSNLKEVSISKTEDWSKSMSGQDVRNVPIKYYKRVTIQTPYGEETEYKEVREMSTTIDLTRHSNYNIRQFDYNDDYICKIGYGTVTFSGVSNTIYITGGTEGAPITMTDVYNADQANGWGRVFKYNNSMYRINCYIDIGNSTEVGNFSIEDEHLEMYDQTATANDYFKIREGSRMFCFKSSFYHLRQGGDDRFMDTDNGDDYTLLEIERCSIFHSVSNPLYIDNWDGNVFINDTTSHGLAPRYDGNFVFKNTTMLSTYYGFRECAPIVDNYKMTATYCIAHPRARVDGEFNITNSIFGDTNSNERPMVLIYGTKPTLILRLVDCTSLHSSNLFRTDRGGSWGSDLWYRSNTFNLETEANASVKLYNQTGILVLNVTSGEDGKITEQIVDVIGHSNTTDYIYYTPFRLVISKEGYRTYNATFNNSLEPINYKIYLEQKPEDWNYSQNLSWKVLNLTDTTILKLSENGSLAIAGRLYELTNTPPPGDTVVFQIANNLWLTESGDMYVKENLHEETNVINIIMVLMFINMLGYAMYKKMRKRDR